MSRWGSAFRIAAAAVVTTFLPGSWAANWQLFASVAESERQRRKRDKANARARNAYNEALKDRLQMLDLQPDMARTLVLGRVRYVEGVRDRWTSGTNSEKLTQIVSYAGHEIDAFESFYVDDMPVTLDGSGWVQEAPYKATVNQPTEQTATLDGSGGAVVVLSYTPIAGTVTASWSNGTGDNSAAGVCTVSMAGSTATISGGLAGAVVNIVYERSVGTTYLRIRTYSGAAAQNIGSGLAAEYPGKITATDSFAGIAAAAIDMVYSPDVFPQGPPSITAVMRGAKCYDPRLDSTVAGGSGSHRIATPSTWAWTENPALHALRYALWSSGLGLSYGRGITARTLADVVAAANQCDISTTFTLRKPDTTTTTVTLPRHRCGMTISADAEPKTVMDSIVDTMAGEWAFDGPELRLRAGVKAASVASIDQTWLVESYEPGQEDDEQDPIVTATQSISREQRWNRVVGKCVDPAQRYQFLPYPAVSDAALISAKGEKRGDLDLPGVNHVAHAQHLASIEIRRRQAGTLQVVQCDPRGELLQLFDVVTETIPDYGVSAKPFEVVGVDISLSEAPVRLMLREIADTIFTVDAELKGVDPAPDSSLRAPWEVGALGALTVASGTAALIDNTIVARAQVTWPAVTGEWIRNGGDIEIQYTRADIALPAGDWATWVEPGNSTQAIIPGLLAGRPYVFRGRLVQRMPLVRGPWTALVLHIMSRSVTGVSTMGGGNMLRNSGFEVDSNADGTPDNWTGATAGTVGTVTNALFSGGVGGGAKLVQIAATNLGTAVTDVAQLYQSVDAAALVGNRVTVSVWVQGGSAGTPDANVQVAFFNASSTLIGFERATAVSPNSTWQRIAATAQVPVGAETMWAQVFMNSRKTSAGASAMNFDGVQLEIGATPTGYAPRADELLAGTVQTVNLVSNAATTVQWTEVNQEVHAFALAVGVQDRTFSAIDWANTLGSAVDVEVTTTGERKIQTSAGQSGAAEVKSWISITNETDGGILVSSTQDWMPSQLTGVAAGATARYTESTAFVVSVPVGKTFRFTPYCRVTTLSGSTGVPTLTTSAYTMRVTAVKR